MPASPIRAVWSRVEGYAIASGFVALALGVAWLFGDIMPFTFFLAAIMLTAWYSGAPAGFFGLVLSLATLNALLGRPPYMLGVSVEYLPRLATFSVTGLLLIWMSAARRRAERALRAARDELDERVQARTASLEQAYHRLQTEIEERKRGEQRLALAKRRARERVLEARFTAQLEERTRLAREIHDTLLQGFTGVSLQLLAAMGRRNNPAEYEAALGEVLTLAQKTLADARQAVWDMRPPALEEGDFAPTLGAVLERTLSDHSLVFDYVVRGLPRLLSKQAETVVFRVAQEAVANVVKHASAHAVRVTLAYENSSVRLTVADDGCGFTVDADFRTYAGHWGLLGMRERASQLRGKFVVRSAPGQGTRIVLQVPSGGVAAGAREMSAHPSLTT
jgi:signal transduction histidine kinase